MSQLNRGEVTRRGAVMRREIGEQPEVLRRTIAALAEPAAEVAALVRARGIRTIVTAGRGSSHNVARYATYALGVQAGLLVADSAPSLMTAYGRRPALEGTLLLAVSQSGAGEDIRAVAAAARAAGAPVVAITNEPAAAILAEADVALVTPAGSERSVPATKTYTAAMVAVTAIAGALDDRPGAVGNEDLAGLADAVARVIGREPDLAAIGEGLAGTRRCVVLGRGFNRSSAAEIALKIQETSYVSAQDYGARDFLHGPVAVVEAGFEVLAVVAAGPTAAAVCDGAARAAGLGARVTLLADGPPESDVGGSDAIVLDLGLREELTPVAFAVAGQLVALHLALAGGYDPDRPRGLTKVTSTR